jgi:hypothetical protein
MKHIVLTFSALLLFQASFAQNNLFDFLQGTWKMDGKEIYEHWDKLNNYSMKGVSYAIDDEQIVIFEYLEMLSDNDIVIYVATAVGENDGLGIAFTMTRSDSIFSFENPQHDFPKIITYQKISDNEMTVKISDGFSKEIIYSMRRK